MSEPKRKREVFRVPCGGRRACFHDGVANMPRSARRGGRGGKRSGSKKPSTKKKVCVDPSFERFKAHSSLPAHAFLQGKGKKHGPATFHPKGSISNKGGWGPTSLSSGLASHKRKRQGEVTFDADDRAEYLTGFRARKAARRKKAEDEEKIRNRRKRLADRKEVREHLPRRPNSFIN